MFDIVEGGPKVRAQAEEKLKRYREGNEAVIEENRLAAQDAAELERRREKAIKEVARQRRLAEMKEEEEVKMDMERSRRDVLNRLATEDVDAETITRQAQKVILKKTSARRSAADRAAEITAMEGGLTIRGLKKKEPTIKEEPYDPFGGLEIKPSMYVLQDGYENPWLDGLKSNTSVAGGWEVHDYYARTMFEAFSGLGVFIEDEVAERETVPAVIGTAAGTEVVAPIKKQKIKVESDDIF